MALILLINRYENPGVNPCHSLTRNLPQGPSVFGLADPEVLPTSFLDDDTKQRLDDHTPSNPETASPPLVSKYLQELRDNGENPILEQADHVLVIYNVPNMGAPQTLIHDDTKVYYDLSAGNAHQIEYKE